jgi:hypothetical protein
MNNDNLKSDFEGLKNWIVRKSIEHRSCQQEEREWQAECIEADVLRKIFDFGVKAGLRVSWCDIEKVLAAEDDEDPEVPEEGIQETLFDVWQRVTDPDMDDRGIEASTEVRELFRLFEESFWPAEDET